jgi:2,4-didehydro-3-deoxy-L-rhamnonate hydrolase
MKIVRFGPPGQERPGVVAADGSVADASSLLPDVFVGSDGFDAFLLATTRDLSLLPKVSTTVRLGVPIGNISKVVGVGLNYREHARESKASIPLEPIVFLKANTAISGPNDDVLIPIGSKKTDWEVELAVVIGKRAKNIPPATALDHVLGYCICNDVSEREHQLERGGQWTKGKSHDTFCPLGPWLVTKAEVPNPQALGLWCEVNGVRRQNSNTADMIFPVAECLSYISRFMTLNPGDVITTGTPQGVGMGLTPQQYLVAGDTMRLGIEALGEQFQRVRDGG